MDKLIIDDKSTIDVCDICYRTIDVFAVKGDDKETGHIHFDICENCLLALGTAIRKRAINKILDIKKEM